MAPCVPENVLNFLGEWPAIGEFSFEVYVFQTSTRYQNAIELHEAMFDIRPLSASGCFCAEWHISYSLMERSGGNEVNRRINKRELPKVMTYHSVKIVVISIAESMSQ